MNKSCWNGNDVEFEMRNLEFLEKYIKNIFFSLLNELLGII